MQLEESSLLGSESWITTRTTTNCTLSNWVSKVTRTFVTNTPKTHMPSNYLLPRISQAMKYLDTVLFGLSSSLITLIKNGSFRCGISQSSYILVIFSKIVRFVNKTALKKHSFDRKVGKEMGYRVKRVRDRESLT